MHCLSAFALAAMGLLAFQIALAAVASFTAGMSVPPEARLAARAPAEAKNVIVQMFEWTWDSVAAECTNFLGPNGFGFVQVSPPQEHISGAQWWTDYQPVSYTLTSKRGNRSQFANMITTCHAAGVKVIAGIFSVCTFLHATGLMSLVMRRHHLEPHGRRRKRNGRWRLVVHAL